MGCRLNHRGRDAGQT